MPVLKNMSQPVRDKANYNSFLYLNPAICQCQPRIVYWLSIMNRPLQLKMCVLIRELPCNYIYILMVTLTKSLNDCPSLFSEMIIFNYDV